MGIVELDSKDKQIMYQLDVNARQPVSAIAKKVRLSREVVSYRIKNLERMGIIEGYYAAIDIVKLGYMYCRVLIKYENISLEQEKEVLQMIKSLPYVGWISNNDGRWDLTLVIWAKTLADFEKAYDDLRFKLGKYFQETYVSIAFKIYHFRHNYLFGTKDFSQAILGDPKIAKCDEVDLRVLKLLARNARMSTVDIAKSLGLTPNAVKGRIRKMQKQGVIIAFRVKINTDLVGYQHHKIFLTLHNMSERKQNELVAYLRYNPNVVYVTKAFGIADLEFEIMLHSQRELHELIRDLRQKFSDIIKSFDSLIIYEEPLINYLPGE